MDFVDTLIPYRSDLCPPSCDHAIPAIMPSSIPATPAFPVIPAIIIPAIISFLPSCHPWTDHCWLAITADRCFFIVPEFWSAYLTTSLFCHSFFPHYVLLFFFFRSFRPFLYSLYLFLYRYYCNILYPSNSYLGLKPANSHTWTRHFPSRYLAIPNSVTWNHPRWPVPNRVHWSIKTRSKPFPNHVTFRFPNCIAWNCPRWICVLRDKFPICVTWIISRLCHFSFLVCATCLLRLFIKIFFFKVLWQNRYI